MAIVIAVPAMPVEHYDKACMNCDAVIDDGVDFFEVPDDTGKQPGHLCDNCMGRLVLEIPVATDGSRGGEPAAQE